MQRIYTSFISPSDLRGSAIASAVTGAGFLMVGVVASLVLTYDRLVEHLGFRDWFSGWDWAFLLGLMVGPLFILSSFTRSGRARSLSRINAHGILAWARVSKIRQAAEAHGKRQLFFFSLQVRVEDGSAFESKAIDYLPISDGRLHAWTEVYELWFPVLLDPRDRSSAKILWNDQRVDWTSSSP